MRNARVLHLAFVLMDQITRLRRNLKRQWFLRRMSDAFFFLGDFRPPRDMALLTPLPILRPISVNGASGANDGGYVESFIVQPRLAEQVDEPQIDFKTPRHIRREARGERN